VAAGSDNATMAKIYKLPDLQTTRSELLGRELGTQFDWGQRLFAYYGSGDVFDYGEWTSRDMKVMFSRDGVCSAVESALTLPIREADFSIRGAKGDKGELDLAQSVLMTPDHAGGMQTSNTELIGQITSGQIYRRAFFEKVWKVRESDGQIVYDKIAFRPSATCQARYNARTAAAHGFRQQVWLFGGQLLRTRGQKVPGYVDIPHVRSFIYTHGKHREPLTGASEMEISYWCYQTKMKLLYLWYHFLETQALPRVIVYGPDQPSANDRADSIAALKSSGVVGLDYPAQGQKAFETMESNTDAGKFFLDALGFLESWQVHSVLAGFMALTGAATGGRGSYAMSQDQSSFYLKSRQGVANEIAQAYSHQVIMPMVLLNFGPDAAFPTAKFGPLQDEQQQALLTLFGQLSAAPALHIPLPVLDLITERMASILQLDVDQVHDALISTATQRAEALQANPPPGMPPETAASLGGLQGLAQAGVGIANQAAMRPQGAPMRQPPPAPGQAPQAGPPARPTLQQAPQGPPRPPAKPPMTPPRGRMA
jgi:hypothetical protein